MTAAVTGGWLDDQGGEGGRLRGLGARPGFPGKDVEPHSHVLASSL
jgi:hypothetical protein